MKPSNSFGFYRITEQNSAVKCLMIRSIQLDSCSTWCTSILLSMLGVSKCSTYVQPSKSSIDVANWESASTHAFLAQGMWEISKDLKLHLRVWTFSKYFIMIRSRVSNSPFVCPATSWESVNIFSFLMPSSLVILNPARSASYSTWLFNAWKANQSAYLVTIPSEFAKINHAPLSSELDELFTWSIYIGSKHSLSTFSWLISPLVSFWSTSLLAHVHFTIKLAKTYAFVVEWGWWDMSNSLCLTIYFAILSNVPGHCRMTFNSWLVSTSIECA